MKTKLFFISFICAIACSNSNENKPPIVPSIETKFEKRNNLLPSTAIVKNAMDVAVADLNDDGYLDIVLANEFQANTLIFSDGKGAFVDASAAMGNNVHDSEDIAIADFNRDGKLDIIFVSEDDRIHEMYLNLGNGAFQDVSKRLPTSEANAVASFDVNSDGYPDLLIGNAGQNTLLVNKGNGEFTDETNKRLPSINEITQDVKVADLDKDGDIDIVEGNEGKNRILINNNGVFADESDSRLPNVGDIETRKVTPHDFENDGDLDLLICNVGWRPGKLAANFILKNDGKGFFKDDVIKLPGVGGSNCLDGIFMDVNDDGLDDIVLAFALGGNYCQVLIQRNASFTEDSSFEFAKEFGDWLGVIAADFNNDKKLDLFLASRGRPSAIFIRK